jgi:hypothetical protein
MFDWVERELYDKLPKELQEEFDNVWDSAYDYTYKSK